MALEPQELYGSLTSQPQQLRLYPAESGIRPGKLAAISGAPALAHGTPATFDEGSGTWSPWDAGAAYVDEVYTITAGGTAASDGTYTLTVGTDTTSALAHDANSATIEAALEALDSVGVGNVAVTGTGLGSNNGTAILTFDGALSGQEVTVSIDPALLTGAAHVLVNTTDASIGEAGAIEGFLWSPVSTIASSATGELLVQIFREGLVHAGDVPLPTTASQTQAELDVALRSVELRKLGIKVQGLADLP